MNDLISIVVPVYKAEKYLSQCVDSILAQTYRIIDVVLVDDGSPDNSGRICDTYKEKDSRIQVIHQQNLGSVSARKAGIKAAKGKYVTFVDSDDFILVTYIEKIYEKVLSSNADIVTYGFIRYVENDQTKNEKYIDRIKSGIYTRDEIQNEIIPKMICYSNHFEMGIMPSLCCKMFCTELLKKYMLPVDEEITNGDDGACTYESIINANAICVCNDITDYMYRVTENSITQGYDSDFVNHMEHLFCYLHNRLEKYNIDSITTQLLQYEMYMLLVVGPNNVYRISQKNILYFIKNLFRYNNKLVVSNQLFFDICSCCIYITYFEKWQQKAINAIRQKKISKAVINEIRQK